MTLTWPFWKNKKSAVSGEVRTPSEVSKPSTDEIVRKMFEGSFTGGRYVGGNRDVVQTDPGFDGCCCRPYYPQIDWFEACLRGVDAELAKAWAKYVYGKEFLIGKYYADGKTPGINQCRQKPERTHFLFVVAGSESATKCEAA